MFSNHVWSLIQKRNFITHMLQCVFINAARTEHVVSWMNDKITFSNNEFQTVFLNHFININKQFIIIIYLFNIEHFGAPYFCSPGWCDTCGCRWLAQSERRRERQTCPYKYYLKVTKPEPDQTPGLYTTIHPKPDRTPDDLCVRFGQGSRTLLASIYSFLSANVTLKEIIPQFMIPLVSFCNHTTPGQRWKKYFLNKYLQRNLVHRHI